LIVANDLPSEFDATFGWLLDIGHELAPAGVPAVLAAAAEQIGATDALLYLADVEQRQLVPVPVPGGQKGAPPEPLDIDGTLAGRAFQTSEPTGTNDTGPRWFPVRDGADRLGVLRLRFARSDGAVTRAALHLASMIADLVVSKGQYSDLFLQVRRHRPVDLAAELQWQLLPPLTFRTPQLAVAGILEPAYQVAGDSFDYSLDGDVLSAAVFDGVGHNLGSAVATTLAVGAYRNARRRDLDLVATAVEVDTALRTQFTDHTFVTAALTRLDVTTGTLRWLNAGHPRPLLLRDGRVVRTLACRPRPPLGLDEGRAAPEICTEQLEPGDALLLFTDGVVEARDEDGEPFGFTRLGELFRNSAAAGLAPAETMRRLIHQVIAHNADHLRDDATCVLVEWRSR
jgi:serine phosphatase RsbU (regulator of sigma subunit)